MADPSHTLIAAAVHELGRVKGGSVAPHWEDLPPFYQAEMLSLVEQTLAGIPVEQQHEAWFADQALAGWTRGDVFDPVAKTDPRLVHWAAYTPEQQADAYRAVATIRAVTQLATV
jgi:hypothetical protein